uniref:Uncharacterized protein n=1 Tax=uncultured marine virus TaxID=186617 RepID=A0A0F7L5U6_9VIRU|nr:hypothetical protein [uncultured marine virus]
MTDETHRFFRFSNEASYEQLTAAGNTARSLPDEESERWLALWDKTFLDPETNSDRLYCVKRSGILETDDFTLDGIEEINLETYLQRLSWEPPVEEDLEMLDELELID